MENQSIGNVTVVLTVCPHSPHHTRTIECDRFRWVGKDETVQSGDRIVDYPTLESSHNVPKRISFGTLLPYSVADEVDRTEFPWIIRPFPLEQQDEIYQFLDRNNITRWILDPSCHFIHWAEVLAFLEKKFRSSSAIEEYIRSTGKPDPRCLYTQSVSPFLFSHMGQGTGSSYEIQLLQSDEQRTVGIVNQNQRAHLGQFLTGDWRFTTASVPINMPPGHYLMQKYPGYVIASFNHLLFRFLMPESLKTMTVEEQRNELMGWWNTNVGKTEDAIGKLLLYKLLADTAWDFTDMNPAPNSPQFRGLW